MMNTKNLTETTPETMTETTPETMTETDRAFFERLTRQPFGILHKMGRALPYDFSNIPTYDLTPATVGDSVNVFLQVDFYFSGRVADFVDVFFELCPGELSMLTMRKSEAVRVFSKAVRIEKMSDGNTLHLRGKVTDFRRALYSTGADFRAVYIAKTADFLTAFDVWRAGRSAYGYNMGNFAECVSAYLYGETNHPDRNTAPGADVFDGVYWHEVKALFGKSHCQIPLVKQLPELW